MQESPPDNDELRDRAEELLADPRLARAVLAHCPGLPARPAQPSPGLTRVHPGDQMLAHSLRTHGEVNPSVGQYFNVALQQHFAAEQVLDAAFSGGAGRLALLDFACGFGRLARFLVLSRPHDEIWASDIQPEALAFVAEHFGVETVPSAASPADFRPGRRFHFIWAASLFSHLPDGLFRQWLQRLHSLLEPDGVLCFSVHDQSLLPEDYRLPESGMHFSPESEDSALPTSIYGVSHVSEDYVRRAVAEAAGADHPYQRIPRALAHEQDLYVVPRAAARDLSALRGFRRGAWGWTDERGVSESGELHLSGWAASLDDGALEEVDIYVDGERRRCPTGEAREDVGRFFQDPRLDRSGWRFTQALAPDRSEVWIEVSARSRRDERALLYVGPLSNPAHRRRVPGLRSWMRRVLGNR